MEQLDWADYGCMLLPKAPHSLWGLPCTNVFQLLLYIQIPQKTKNTWDIWTPMFIAAALFPITKRGKQPRCPLTNDWISKMWYIHTME